MHSSLIILEGGKGTASCKKKKGKRRIYASFPSQRRRQRGGEEGGEKSSQNAYRMEEGRGDKEKDDSKMGLVLPTEKEERNKKDVSICRTSRQEKKGS